MRVRTRCRSRTREQEEALALTRTEPAPTTSPVAAAARSRALGSPHLVALALVAGAIVFSLAPPADPDVWWHVRTGDWILSHHRLPRVDTWSIGGHGRTWIAHSWLAEVVLSTLHKAFGLRGLSLYRAVGVAVLLGSLAVQAFRRTTPGRALLVTALAVFATEGGWGERPQLMSFLLLIPTAQLVRTAVANDGRRLWWAIPITYVWANTHGLWFLAPALVAIGAVGALERTGANGRTKAFARHVLVAAGCVVAAALTPYGPKLLVQPFKVNGYGKFVTEWGPPDIHSVFGLAFFAMLAAFLFAFARSGQRQDRYLIAQLLFALLLGLLYIRTIAPAAVIMTPLLATALRVDAPQGARRLAPAFTTAVAVLVGVLAVGGGALVLTQEPELPPGAPVAATHALVTAVPGHQRVIDEYAIGGWLLLMAPSAQPAIDGRAEIYPLKFVGDYISALKMSGNWKAVIRPLDANAALLHPETPLVNGLRDELGWHTVYKDDTWVVLVPPGTPSS